jgi:glycosyltransferase involved in cell wall biosynthesis
MVLILIPIFNDWTAASRLLAELDRVLADAGRDGRVLLVDDGSSEPPSAESAELAPPAPARLREIEILQLRRNVGHQRAIAIGLSHAEASIACDAVVVMDGDGEDRPEDVPRLLDELEKNGSRSLVFAERLRRSEGPLFVTMYALYRWLHRLLTGERVRFGNFSTIPALLLGRLVAMSDLWNHYAAAVIKSRIPYATIVTTRGLRYSGATKMNYIALVTHGLSAMSVFGDWIGVRLLAATVGAAAIVLAAIVTSLLLAWTAGTWAPWMPYVLGFLVLLLAQTLAVSLAFVFIILSGRDSSAFIPLRDYVYFVARVEKVSPRSHEAVPLRR